MTVAASVKHEPDADADACKDVGRKPVWRQQPSPQTRLAAAEGVNRRCLGRLLDNLVRAHRWRDAAGVVSMLLPGTQQPKSFEEPHGTFVAAMVILRRLAEDRGTQLGSRSRYYLRTQKVFDVWTQRLIWLPTCAKKHLVKLELALFYLSRGNIDNAYNATRTHIAKKGLQTEPTLNLIHGLISYDIWYCGLPKDMQLEEFDIYNESCTISVASNGCGENDLQDSSEDNGSIDVDDASFPACSSQSSINNGNIDEKMKIPKKSGFLHPLKENDSLGSQGNDEKVDTDFRSVFFDSSDSPTCDSPAW